MKTTGIWTEHQYDIPFRGFGNTVYIRPFGDVHWGATGCDKKLFIEEISEGKGRTDTWYLGMGDYFDIASTSERELLESKILHESTRDTLDDVYRRMADNFLEKIAHCEGRLIGLVEGNHFARLESGITTTMYMCEQLKCAYLGVMTATRLNFINHGVFKTYDIIAHHGMGAARLAGGSINRVSQMAEGFDGDLYLMGHDHKAITHRGSRCYLHNSPHGGLTIKERITYSARTGGYLRGFINKRPSYVADSAKNPLALGGIVVHITPKRRNVDGVRTVELTPRILT